MKKNFPSKLGTAALAALLTFSSLFTGCGSSGQTQADASVSNKEETGSEATSGRRDACAHSLVLLDKWRSV